MIQIIQIIQIIIQTRCTHWQVPCQKGPSLCLF
jgi:hypothetical protein